MPHRIAVDLDDKLWASLRHLSDAQIRDWIEQALATELEARPPQPAPRAFPAYFRYWGKADRVEGEPPTWHPVPYHCLDVAAVGQLLLERHPRLAPYLAGRLGVDPAWLRSWAVFFLALHDIGKLTEAFQGQLPELFYALQGRECRKSRGMRHDSLGYLLWQETLQEAVPSGDRYWREALAQWARTATGHHGQPPRDGSFFVDNYCTRRDLAAVSEMASDFVSLLLPDPTPLANTRDFHGRLREVSWWLAGWSVLCDWLGSNRGYFPYQPDAMHLAVYWREHAMPGAERILAATELMPASAAPVQSIQHLFPHIAEPRPLQALASTLPLSPGPQLFVIEDLTGAGKTEAAFVLAHRLLAARVAEGVYVALPTMATANAMYQRTKVMYRELFLAGSTPSLVLAHGAAHLAEAFTETVAPPVATADLSYDGVESASGHCNAWLADNRKKSLLAQVGVGTIDQALLAVLSNRHQAMRLLGLLGKVLVVDEVHACDAYMQAVLEVLLRCHAQAGGSAILLSATLPREQRQTLVAAYAEGLRIDEPILSRDAYPLLTHVTPEVTKEEAIPVLASGSRELGFALMANADSVVDWIIERATAGDCVCWVRNTVVDAMEAFETLSGRLAGEKLHLFHARFSLCDRLRIETDALRLFGREGSAGNRRGQVLVATQVVEQSLDLDFDCMVSDLAPIDLLLQRAGRLHRHARPGRTGGAVLRVLGPEPTEDAPDGWLATVLPHAVPVYPNHGRLWLTAQIIHQRRLICLPEEARLFIEAVYAPEAQATIPSGLERRSRDAGADDMVSRSEAMMNLIKPELGYIAGTRGWDDDVQAVTRLGEPTVILRLARWDGGKLSPWSDDSRYPWELSQVSIRRVLVAEEAETSDADLRQAIDKVRAEWGSSGKHALLVPLVTEGDTWRGAARDGKGRQVALRYTHTFGLQIDAPQRHILLE